MSEDATEGAKRLDAPAGVFKREGNTRGDLVGEGTPNGVPGVRVGVVDCCIMCWTNTTIEQQAKALKETELQRRKENK
jgi:hypothetical protein